MSYVVLNPSWNIPGSIAKMKLFQSFKRSKISANKRYRYICRMERCSSTEKVDSKEVLDSAILQNVDNLYKL